MDPAADKRLEAVVVRGLLETEQPVVGEVPDARGKTRTQQMAQGEKVIGVFLECL